MSDHNKLNVVLEKAHEMGIRVEVVSDQQPVMRLSSGKKERYTFGNSLGLNNSVSVKISKDKDLTKKILDHAGFCTPKGIILCQNENVLDKLKDVNLKFPVVVKPNDRSLGNDVYIGVLQEEIESLTKRILKNQSSLVIEEYCPGNDYRVLVLNGKVIAACKRIPPFVIGNGKDSLADLISVYNTGRKKPISQDEEFERQLKLQSLKLTDIIPEDKLVYLRFNANVSTGGKVEDVTKKISRYFKKIAIDAVKTLGGRYMGVDIITNDIASKGEYCVTEINGNPDFDIHLYPDYGQVRDPRPLLLKAVFKS